MHKVGIFWASQWLKNEIATAIKKIKSKNKIKFIFLSSPYGSKYHTIILPNLQNNIQIDALRKKEQNKETSGFFSF